MCRCLFFCHSNIVVGHLCSFKASSAHLYLFHGRQGGTGRRRRRLLLSNGSSVDHWALVTALTPFWRCGESDQRYLTAIDQHAARFVAVPIDKGLARAFADVSSTWITPMVHSEAELRSEDPARTLNNEISELQIRVAFPQHWSSGEHEQHIVKLRQLQDQKQYLVAESVQSAADAPRGS